MFTEADPENSVRGVLTIFFKYFVKSSMYFRKGHMKNLLREAVGPIGGGPKVKSAYQNFFFLFLNQNICCGYSKKPSQ